MKTKFRHDIPRDTDETIAGQRGNTHALAARHRHVSGRVATAFYRILFFGLLAAGAVTPARACSTFELVGNGSMVVGHNLDWYVPVDGSVFVNRRGLKKTAWLNSGLQWVSHFGSLTFNSGPGPEPEFPDGGINEAGLVVAEMTLIGTQTILFYKMNSIFCNYSRM